MASAPKRSKPTQPTNEEIFENVWAELTLGIRQIQNGEPMTKAKFLELYTKVYDTCTKGQGTNELCDKVSTTRTKKMQLTNVIVSGNELYNNLKELLKDDMSKLVTECAEKSGPETLLSFYAEKWEQYNFSAKVIDGIFSYLNRHFISRESAVNGNRTEQIFRIYELALDIWKNTIFETYNQNLVAGVLGLLDKERVGEPIKGNLIKNIVDSFIALGLSDVGDGVSMMTLWNTNEENGNRPSRRPVTLETYQTFFESRYLENVRQFYENESHAFLQNQENSFVDFLKKVEQRIQEEENRVERYLHLSTKSKLKEEIQETLIRRNLDAIYTEFSRLLNQEQNSDDIARTYNLVKKLDDGVQQLADYFRTHIVSVGRQKLEDLGKLGSDSKLAKAFVGTILEILDYFQKIVQSAFNDDPALADALKSACKDIVNKNLLITGANSNLKSSELLAKYCDVILRKSNNKNVGETQIEDWQNDMMIIFEMLEDKDAFQKFYTKMFANRMVQQISVSDEAESTMLAKLKIACGFEYTAKLQKIFNDIRLSRELSNDFRTEVNKSETHFKQDFEVIVLASSIWPFPCKSNSEFLLPEELQLVTQTFQNFYNKTYNGRKLTWLHSRSHGELIGNCFQSRQVFTVSAYQMGILLAFNANEKLTFKDIQETTKLESVILTQALEHFIKSSMIINSDKTFHPESIFEINKNYKAKKMRVNINAPLKIETKNEIEQTQKDIEEDRKLKIEACIVRIMKDRKTEKLQTLMAEVMQQMASHFKAEVDFIKKCIDKMVDKKDYLEKVENEGDVDTYAYVA